MSLSLSVSSLSSGQVALSVYGSPICMAQKLMFTRMAIFMASLTALNMLTSCVSTKERFGDCLAEFYSRCICFLFCVRSRSMRLFVQSVKSFDSHSQLLH